MKHTWTVKIPSKRSAHIRNDVLAWQLAKQYVLDAFEQRRAYAILKILQDQASWWLFTSHTCARVEF